MGGNWTHQFLNVTAAQADAQFTWDGSYSGLTLVDFMMGKPASFSQGGALNYYMRQNIVTSYITDTWAVRPGLTVSMGLRWDPFLPYHDSLGQVTGFRSGYQSQRFPNAPAGSIYAGDPGFPMTFCPWTNT